MQIKATRSVEQSIISTTLTIDTFRSNSLTPDEERELLNDYKLELNTGAILFSRYVSLDAHKNPDIVPDPAEPENYDLVTIAVPIETYEITEDMEIKYAIDVRRLNVIPDNYTHIQDNICLAKAMICVF